MHTDLQAKLDHLSRPEAYPEDTQSVEVVTTHMSCVFLTTRYAYKIKKPVRYPFLDFSTAESRRRDCRGGVSVYCAPPLCAFWAQSCPDP